MARIRALAPSLPAELLREAGTCVLGLAEGVEGSAEYSPVLPLWLAFTDQQAEPAEVGDAGSVGSLEGEEHLADEPGNDVAEADERPRETATFFVPSLIGGTEYEVPLEEVPPADNCGLPLARLARARPVRCAGDLRRMQFGRRRGQLPREPGLRVCLPIELRGVAGSDVCGFSTRCAVVFCWAEPTVYKIHLITLKNTVSNNQQKFKTLCEACAGAQSCARIRCTRQNCTARSCTPSRPLGCLYHTRRTAGRPD